MSVIGTSVIVNSIVINPFDRLAPDHYNFLAVEATRETLIAEEQYRRSARDR